MTNLEFYKDKISKIGLHYFAVNKETGEPCRCIGMSCDNCKCRSLSTSDSACEDTLINWLLEEHEEHKEHGEQEIDWSTIPVDTKILVRNDEDDMWVPKHFAKYDEKTGKIFAWLNGRTSWTKTNAMDWKFAKLAEGVDEND